MSNRMESNREIAKNDKSRIKPAPVCKAMCNVYFAGIEKYKLFATTKEMLEAKKKRHASSYKDRIVTFGKTVEL